MFSSTSKYSSSSVSDYKKESKYESDDDNICAMESKREKASSITRERSADRDEIMSSTYTDLKQNSQQKNIYVEDSSVSRGEVIAYEDYQNDMMGDFDNEEFDEEVFACDNGKEISMDDLKFDETIGKLEELLMDDSNSGINQVVQSFCIENCDVFEEFSDENKLCYTDIFNQYTTVIENFITEYLRLHVTNFDMTEFLEQISMRSEEVNQDLYDILMSFTDFEEFKSLMIHTKNEKRNSEKLKVEAITSSSLRVIANQELGATISSNMYSKKSD